MILCSPSVVSVLVTFHLMFVQIIFSSVKVAEGHLLGKRCSIGCLVF